MPVTAWPATTIEAWWLTILVALTGDVDYARLEGLDRAMKETSKVACGSPTWTRVRASQPQHDPGARRHERMVAARQMRMLLRVVNGVASARAATAGLRV
jgi:hypothetical protein